MFSGREKLSPKSSSFRKKPASTSLKWMPEELAERELQGRRIHASRDRLSEGSRWVSRTETVFDGTYRFMLRAAKAQQTREKDEMTTPPK